MPVISDEAPPMSALQSPCSFGLMGNQPHAFIVVNCRYLAMVSISMPEKPNAESPSTATTNLSGRTAAAAMA